MSNDDVFAQTEGENGGTDPLTELVGDGKKFKTVQELAKGKLESDQFIDQLQGELKQVRDQMSQLEETASKKETVSDLIAAVKQANKATEGGKDPITEENLKEMVDSIMDNRYEKQTRLTNYQQANQAVLDKFNGDVEAARTYIAERAKQLGLTADKLKALGEESPSAFRQLMEVASKTGSQSVTGIPEIHRERGQNPASAEVIDGHHTKAYYDRLKKEMGRQQYWNNTKVQGQYYRDALALGDRFNKS